MSANAILFGTRTLYRVASNQVEAIRELLSGCPKFPVLDDVLMDLEAIRDVLNELDGGVVHLEPEEIPSQQPEVVTIASNHAVSTPSPQPSTVKVGAFTIQTTIPDDHKLQMLGTPILVAYAKHFGVEDRSSKEAMINGLKAKRDTRETLRPFDLASIRITSTVKTEMMQRRWTQKDVDAFCKGAKMQSVDAILFVQELSDVVPNDKPEPKPIDTPVVVTKGDAPKPVEVKTTKPVSTPTSVTPKPVGRQNSNPASEEEIQAAQKCGLNLIHYRLLRALSDGKAHTYRQIEKKTGYYSILTAQLRTEKIGSLGNKGLVKEEDLEEPESGKNKLHFTITKAGLALLKKAN